MSGRCIAAIVGRMSFLGTLAAALWLPLSFAAAEERPEVDLQKLGFDKILCVTRFQHQSNHYYTDFINSGFRPGGSICVVDLKTGQATELVKELQGGVFGSFDLDFDGRKIVFAWKKAEREGYRIYECNADGSGLRQVTFPQPDEAELVKRYERGYHHGTDDMDPCYLPDGGICFISTRCQYGILCDPPDIFTTTVLYRCDRDGKNMMKLSNSSVSEAAPSIIGDGRILYTRWEYVDKGAVSVKCLWAMRPDGSGSSEIYANDIALPPTFTQGRDVPGTNNLFVAAGVPHCPNNSVGTIIRIDTTRDIRTRDPMTYMTPDVDIQAEGGFAFRQPDGAWRHDGRGRGRLFRDPYPLSDKLFLVSHKPAGPNWNDPKGYGIYWLDEKGNVAEVYRDPNYSCFTPIPLRSRERPPVLSTVRDAALAEKGQAVCVVEDVYRGLTGVERGKARYIRIIEQVPRPWAARYPWKGDEYDQQYVVVSKDGSLGLKALHGVVPVEADGSAHFVVPADRNIYFELLDENYMELQRERTFVNYRPGEVRTCVGCHEKPAAAPRNRPSDLMAYRRAPSVPGPQPGESQAGRAIHYPADVQPVWDKHCVSCHNEKDRQGGLDLSGTMTERFSRSYESLVPERRKGFHDPKLLGPIIGENHPKTGNVHYLPPKSLGSHASVLVAMLAPDKVQLADPADAERVKKLLPAHKDVHLSPEELVRVTTWIESNGQYYGSYWGRRNLMYKDHPNFRPTPTLDDATRMTSPIPEDRR